MKKQRQSSGSSKRSSRPRTSVLLSPTPTASNGQVGGALEEQQKKIQDLIDLLKRNNLTELEWECEGFRVRVRDEIEPRTAVSSSSSPVLERQTAKLPVEKPETPDTGETAGFVTITSPIVGTFYRSPSPDADPYIEENDTVKKGQVLCIVEAMKLMNEIESEVDGRIVKILAESTRSVEYGQPLFLIDPSPEA